jgi:hypothetical protein
MLTRRRFAGFASCAICELPSLLPPKRQPKVRRPRLRPASREISCRRPTVRRRAIRRSSWKRSSTRGCRSGATRIRESNPPTCWRAASSFPSKVKPPARSSRATASKSRRTRPMRVASPAAPRAEFSSRMWWRRESPSPLQPEGSSSSRSFAWGHAPHVIVAKQTRGECGHCGLARL